MNAFHPMILNDPAIWALPASEFKLYAALLVFVNPNGNGAFPSNETLAEMVGVNERSIQRLLAELESKGIVERVVYENSDGSFKRTITVNYVPVIGRGRASVSKTYGAGDDAHDTPRVTSVVGGTLPVTRGGALPVTSEHTHSEHTQKNNVVVGGSDTSSAESGHEPFEFPAHANPSRLPTVSSLPIRPRYQREHVPVNIPPEMRDRIYQCLGTRGDEFVRYLTQEMIDKPGFIEDVVKTASKGKKPIGLAITLLCRFGNWLDPDERRAADKKLQEEMFYKRLGVARE